MLAFADSSTKVGKQLAAILLLIPLEDTVTIIIVVNIANIYFLYYNNSCVSKGV
jgi:hypothetical protein